MKILRLMVVVGALALARLAHGAETVTAYLSVTNVPVTSNSVAVTGVSVTFTNDTPASSYFVLTTNSVENAATNLFIGLSGVTFTNVNRVDYSNATTLIFYGMPDVPLAVTVNGGWASVTYSTNQVTDDGKIPIIPMFEAVAQEEWTNQADGLIAVIDFSNATMRVTGTAPALANFLNLSATAIVRTNLSTRGGTNYSGVIDGGTFSGTIDALSAVITGYGRLGSSNTWTGTNTFNRLVLPSGAGIVIGTTSAQPSFVNGIVVEGETTVPLFVLSGYGTFQNGGLIVNRYRGNKASPSNVLAGDQIGYLSYLGGTTNGTGTRTAFGLSVTALEDFNLTNSMALVRLQAGRRSASGNSYATVISFSTEWITNAAHVVMESNLVVKLLARVATLEADTNYTTNFTAVTANVSTGTVARLTGTNTAAEILQVTKFTTNSAATIDVPADVGSLAAGHNVVTRPTNGIVRFGATAGIAFIDAVTGGFGDGDRFLGINGTGYSLVITNESGFTGTAADRIRLAGGVSGVTVPIDGLVWFAYDGALSRWRVDYGATNGATVSATNGAGYGTALYQPTLHNSDTNTGSNTGMVWTATSTNGAGQWGGGLVPVGGVVAWMKSLTNTVPALPAWFVECNGQTLSDSESVFNGLVIPDLNGALSGTNRFLRGATTSGTQGGAETHEHGFDASQTVASGGDFTVAENGGGTTASTNLPPFYNVVWVMRVK